MQSSSKTREIDILKFIIHFIILRKESLLMGFDQFGSYQNRLT